MLKHEAVSLFFKLFQKSSRTRKNWKEMLESLERESEITYRQSSKWLYYGRHPFNAPALKGGNHAI